jgi:hypothetical protein
MEKELYSDMIRRHRSEVRQIQDGCSHNAVYINRIEVSPLNNHYDVEAVCHSCGKIIMTHCGSRNMSGLDSLIDLLTRYRDSTATHDGERIR